MAFSRTSTWRTKSGRCTSTSRRGNRRKRKEPRRAFISGLVSGKRLLDRFVSTLKRSGPAALLRRSSTSAAAFSRAASRESSTEAAGLTETTPKTERIRSSAQPGTASASPKSTTMRPYSLRTAAPAPLPSALRTFSTRRLSNAGRFFPLSPISPYRTKMTDATAASPPPKKSAARQHPAQRGHCVLDGRDGERDLVFGGQLRQADPDRAFQCLLRQPQRLQDVADRHRPGRAGRARGDVDGPLFQRVDQDLSPHAGKREVGDVGGSSLPSSPVEPGALDLQQFSDEPLPQRAKALPLLSGLFRQGSQGGAEARDAGHVLGAGPQAPFLAPLAEKRLDLKALSHVESAHAFRPVDLVPAHGDQVDA